LSSPRLEHTPRLPGTFDKLSIVESRAWVPGSVALIDSPSDEHKGYGRVESFGAGSDPRRLQALQQAI
jgi:hypothetical protein